MVYPKFGNTNNNLLVSKYVKYTKEIPFSSPRRIINNANPD